LTEEDSELEKLQAKRLAEMQRNLSSQKQKQLEMPFFTKLQLLRLGM